MGSRLDREREVFDRWGLRSLWGVFESLNLSIRDRDPRLVYFREGRWLNRFRKMVIPWPTPAAPRPEVWMRRTCDIFFYDYRPAPGDVVIDVGAGFGAETAVASGLVGQTGRVVAVEAHPRTFDRLADLVRLNPSMDNVRLHNIAASNTPGHVLLSDEAQPDVNSVVKGGFRKPLRVPAMTLDDLLRSDDIESIDLLKMNIEGAEVAALEGMQKSICRVHRLAVSCHDFLAERHGEQMRTKAFVSTFLRDNGFELRTRAHDPRPAVRDYVYAWRPSTEVGARPPTVNEED